MDKWKKFNKTSIPDKEAFYSELNKEGMTDEGYAHAQKVWKVWTCMFKAIHYCLQICLKTLEINILRFIKLIVLIFCQLED